MRINRKTGGHYVASCCRDTTCELDALRGRQSAVLKIVLAINALMFIVEASAGLLAHSTALLADSLDMLGDALAYAFSLYVIARGRNWQAISALLKGLIMMTFSFFVLAEAVYKIVYPAIPVAETIGAVGMLALSANALCTVLLLRHRRDNINMRSAWLCSRNDLLANTSVLLAAIGVWLTSTRWPDVLVGLLITVIFARSATQVIRSASGQLHAARA